MYELLDKVNSPKDIKALSIEELGVLCSEIRDYIIRCCAVNPGHLASSLGAVELIVGYHYVFDSPRDKIVFDVGHQAYAHKILTGRREAFTGNRKKDGISGFPNMEESTYDSFGTGHSSTSISAALGLAQAAKLEGRAEKIVALIGDGAMTGGLAFEGLNNAGALNSDLLVILNDNNQSIDGNLGAIHNHLLKITTSDQYNRMKDQVWDRLGESGFRSFIQRWLRSLKSWAVKSVGGDIFEALGFRYFGPIDGNDVATVVSVLQKLRNIPGPRLLHCLTLKGKGFKAAEEDPVTWHAPGMYDPKTGERIVIGKHTDRYQDVFGQVLCELAEKDSRVVGITPAMATGCGMSRFASVCPERFFDVGIEEEHAVTFSAGLAAGGMRPFCNIYSAFSQRAYDQIIHDVALQKLPVVICLDRAGLVGEDGATHQGLFDMAAYRSIPDCIVSSPKDEIELKNLMYTALNHERGPFIIRYPRGMGEGVDWKDSPFTLLPVGKAETLIEGDEIAVVATGHLAGRAFEAASDFPGRVGAYNFRFVKPLDTEILDKICKKYRLIVTVEDGCEKGGLYGAVCEYIAKLERRPAVLPLAVTDCFVAQDRQKSQRHEFGLDTEGIKKILQKSLEN